MAGDLLIRGARLADEPGAPHGDLLVADGRIAARGVGLAVPGDAEVIEADGLVALPGAIDGLAHLAGAPGAAAPADDLGSGTVAAARGGTTTVVAVAPQAALEPVRQTFEDAARRTAGNVFVDWLVTPGRRVADGRLGPDLAGLAAEPGLAGVLVELDGAGRAARGDVDAVLAAAAEAGVTCLVRLGGADARLEARRLAALADAAALAGARALVGPVATAAGLAALDDDALDAFTTAHHLCLPALAEGAVAPPLGDDADREALWAAIAAGRLEVVSDHRPPPMRGGEGHVGIGGIELLVAALHAHGVAAGRIDLAALAELVAARPARRLGLWPRKGSLAVGADADVALLDPAERWTVTRAALEGRGRAPAWEGHELVGRVRTVLGRGDVLVRDAAVLFRPGRGRLAVGDGA